jgi:hypothetical protein
LRLGAGSNQVNTVNPVKTHRPHQNLLHYRPEYASIPRMRKEETMPARVETQHKEALERICVELGLTTSNVTRMLVKSFITHYDRNKGEVVFPLILTR